MDGSVIIKTEIDTKDFDRQLELLESRLEELEIEYEKKGDSAFYKNQTKDLVKLNSEMETTRKKISKLKEEQIKLNNQGFVGIQQTVNQVGKGLEKSVKSVKKWALAIFGIRTAYMGIRSAINTIAGNDEQLKADIDYIKTAIAYTLEPVVRGIVNLVKQLLMYLGYIIKAWTGKNIFENANKSLKNANKQAKELQKITTKFDEMEILQDNKGTSTGAATPSFDLSNVGEMKMPGWVDFIAKNGQEIVAIILAIGSAIELLKLNKFLKNLGLIKNTLKATTALGIGTIIAGAALALQDIIGFIKDPSWQGFINILTDIGIIVGGIIMMSNPLAGILTALGSLLVKLVVNNWDAIVEILSGIANWFYKNVVKPVADFAKELYAFLMDALVLFYAALQVLLYDIPIWIYNNVIKPIVDAIKTAFNWFNTNIIQPIINVISSTIDFVVTAFKNFIQILKTAFIDIPKWIYTNVIKPIGDFFNGLWDGVKDKFSSVWDFIKNAFTKGGELFDGISEGIVNAFKTVVNFLIDGINFVIAIPFNTINGLLNTIRNVNIPIIDVKPFKGLWNENPLPVPAIPKLAKGAIASYPGRGIPTTGGGARWAEAGQEAYLPLTDEQIMSTLGENIGKHVTIHATIINQMGSRTLSRQLKIIKGESDFAFNR